MYLFLKEKNIYTFYCNSYVVVVNQTVSQTNGCYGFKFPYILDTVIDFSTL